MGTQTLEINKLSGFIEKVKFNRIDQLLHGYYEIPDFSDIPAIEIWMQESSTYKKFRKSLAKVAQKIGLPDRYIEWLEKLIIFNISMAPVHKIDTEFRFNEKTNETELWLRIYSDTRIEHIVGGWNDITKKQSRLTTYNKKTSSNSDISLMKFVHDSKISGKTNDEINKVLMEWKSIKLDPTQIAKWKYEYETKFKITDFSAKTIL